MGMKNFAIAAVVVAAIVAFAGVLFASQGGVGRLYGAAGQNGTAPFMGGEKGWSRGIGSPWMVNGTDNNGAEAPPFGEMRMRGRMNNNGDGMISPFGGKRGAWMNGTNRGCSLSNSTDCMAPSFRVGRSSRWFAEAGMNETAHLEFENAVDAGDYAVAMRLHAEHGFGGPIFEKLNETTFAKWSQTHSLGKELVTDLGLNQNPAGFRLGRASRTMGGAAMPREN